MIKMNLVTLAGASFALYLTRIIDEYSRTVLILFVIIDVVLMFIVHQIYKRYLPVFYRMSGTARQLLLVAPGAMASQLIAEIRSIRDCSYAIKGIVILDGAEGGELDGVPVVGVRKDLVDYCLAASLDEVIISADRETEESLREEMENIAAMGLTIHLQIPVLELKEAPQRMLSQFGRLHMITYANKVAPFGQLMLKRLLDILGALVGMAILAVLTVILTPVIKLDSPGPGILRPEAGGAERTYFQNV